MSIYEIAAEITKVAIENGMISKSNNATTTKEEIEAKNQFNTKQICDFYAEIFNTVSNSNKH